LLRWLHFLALGYLAIGLLEGRERILDHPAAMLVVRVGQQALATFVTSMVLAQIAGMLLDRIGRDLFTVPLINLAGFACLIAIATLVRYFKRQPWRNPAPPESERDRAALGVPSE
jgi:MFS family permease